MRKFNCPALTTKKFSSSISRRFESLQGVCTMYKLEKSENVFSWKVMRWALVPSAILFVLALTMYCIVDVADHHAISPDRHKYIESDSLDELQGNRLDDVILDFDGVTYNFPIPENDPAEGRSDTNVTEPKTEEDNNMASSTGQDLATSEVSNNANWFGPKVRMQQQSTSASPAYQQQPSLQEMSSTLHDRGVTASFVDRLILSFDSSRRTVPPPYTFLRGVSVSPRGETAIRRKLPNGHKYGEYQASPTMDSHQKGVPVSTVTPRVSPTLPSLHPTVHQITPEPVNKTENESICHSPNLSVCRGVLPWDIVAQAIVPGVESPADLEAAMPYFDMILDSGCSPRAREFICSLLEPECQMAGNSVLPPCRKTCKAIAEDCSEFIVDTLDLSKIFNCDMYPDLDNPGECVNLARGECLTNEFQCPDETCIPKRWVCDNIRDCPLGADEINCTKCEPDEFQCRSDHKCIPGAWKCDGNRDCSDGSDEYSCPHEMMAHVHTSPCPADELRCVDGRCITLQQICDKIVDCADAADEANCSLPYT